MTTKRNDTVLVSVMVVNNEMIKDIGELLKQGIIDRIPDVTQNGDPIHNYPGYLNYSFAYVEGESLLMSPKNVVGSSGLACTLVSLKPS